VIDTPFDCHGIAGLAAAFRNKGLGSTIHFSHNDWNVYRFRWDLNNRFCDPKYSQKTSPIDGQGWIEPHRKQLQELAGNYGPLMWMSLDTGGIPLPKGSFYDILETVKRLHMLQPECQG